MARAKSIDVVEQALKEVKTVISRNHGGDDTFFRTWNAKKGIESGKRMIFIIESVLVVIASVSLDCCGYRDSQYYARLRNRTDTGDWTT